MRATFESSPMLCDLGQASVSSMSTQFDAPGSERRLKTVARVSDRRGVMTPQVLIVEGDDCLYQWLQSTLQAAGYKGLRATGEDAMDILETHDIRVVLIERCLPCMDGFSLLWCVAVDYPNIPVVVLSADNAFASVVEAMRLGALDYLVKPFDPATLLETIAHAIASTCRG
ncbi:MAG: hypothetical protein C5B48_05825 [Candidatus Rokuibacteriota bacterium]|nr:MAG: hypothetical protein C5B48_05825 [Candidatus Rokubacteria bacterium]